MNPAINSFIIEIDGFLEKNFQVYPRFYSCTQIQKALNVTLKNAKLYKT